MRTAGTVVLVLRSPLTLFYVCDDTGLCIPTAQIVGGDKV